MIKLWKGYLLSESEVDELLRDRDRYYRYKTAEEIRHSDKAKELEAELQRLKDFD